MSHISCHELIVSSLIVPASSLPPWCIRDPSVTSQSTETVLASTWAAADETVRYALLILIAICRWILVHCVLHTAFSILFLPGDGSSMLSISLERFLETNPAFLAVSITCLFIFRSLSKWIPRYLMLLDVSTVQFWTWISMFSRVLLPAKMMASVFSGVILRFVFLNHMVTASIATLAFCPNSSSD